ncbi:MAG: helix-turn-helix domain-containing protein [Ignavibacteriaceae bacterium]|nr:helix-turn-helix domain-containing protein [Ignavibacteriaceae bacterium]
MRNRGREPGRRRSSKDYSMAYKLQVVGEVEKGEMTYKQAQKKYGIQGRSTVLQWLRKYGRFDWKKGVIMKGKATPAGEISKLKKELETAKAEVEVLQLAIDIADKELGTNIRKKYLAKLSGLVDNKGRISVSEEYADCLATQDKRTTKPSAGNEAESKKKRE